MPQVIETMRVKRRKILLMSGTAIGPLSILFNMQALGMEVADIFLSPKDFENKVFNSAEVRAVTDAIPRH